MTTIATDGKTLAYDTAVICGGIYVSLDTDKGVMLADGSIAAFAGPVESGLAFVEWLKLCVKTPNMKVPKPEMAEDFRGWLLNPKTGLLLEYENKLFPMRVSTPAAIGAGCDIARGAMAMGASPLEAVQAAIRVAPVHTAGEARSLPKADPAYTAERVTGEEGFVQTRPLNEAALVTSVIGLPKGLALDLHKELGQFVDAGGTTIDEQIAFPEMPKNLFDHTVDVYSRLGAILKQLGLLDADGNRAAQPQRGSGEAPA